MQAKRKARPFAHCVPMAKYARGKLRPQEKQGEAHLEPAHTGVPESSRAVQLALAMCANAQLVASVRVQQIESVRRRQIANAQAKRTENVRPRQTAGEPETYASERKVALAQRKRRYAMAARLRGHARHDAARDSRQP